MYTCVCVCLPPGAARMSDSGSVVICPNGQQRRQSQAASSLSYGRFSKVKSEKWAQPLGDLNFQRAC